MSKQSSNTIRLLLMSLFFSLAVLQVRSFAQSDDSSCVEAAQISFETKNDDKDADTRAWAVLLGNGAPTQMGRTVEITGHFADHTTNGPYDFNITTPRAPDGRCAVPYAVLVHIEPNGHDTWIFATYIRYRMNSGDVLEGRSADIFRLSQDHKEDSRIVHFAPVND